MSVSPSPVQKPVHNPRTLPAKPANTPDFALLAKFRPEPWVPVSPRAERLVMAALLLFVALEAYVIYWMLT